MMLAAIMDPDLVQGADDAGILLVQGLRRGDPDAITVVLGRYRLRLFRFLLRLVQDRATAEDLFQQTWIRVMEKIGKYNAQAKFDTWLFSVAHNLAIDHLRRKRGLSLDWPNDVGTPGERLVAAGADP